MMQQSKGQASVKDFLIAGYEGKLKESELLQSTNSIYDFCSILLDVAREQNLTNAGHDSNDVRTTPI